MTIDAEALLQALHSAAASGQDLAALDLHVDALVAARAGDLARATRSFAAAQEWEAKRGYVDGALHTAHQMALASNFGGDLLKLDAYYHETTTTLTKMRNRKGVALCLRSVGEIAVVRSNRRELDKAWEVSERLFAVLHAPEADQLRTWRARIQEALDTASK